MCKTAGPRYATDFRNAAIKAVTAYRANRGSTENKQAMVLAVLQYDATPQGLKRLVSKACHPSLTEADRIKIEQRISAAQKLRAQQKIDAKREQWLHLDGVDSRWRGDEKYRPDISNPMVAKAYVVAVRAHENISRKSGEPYLNHPLRVAKKIQEAGYMPEIVAVALMHDAVEDSDLTLADLRAFGFSPRIISGIDSVTKRKGETYPEAVSRAASHPDGMLVKLSDNLDNSSPEQLLPFSEEKRQKQVRKYEPARVTLLRAITGGADIEPHAVFTKTYRIKLSLPSGSITA
jgi:hypothetical protein